MTKRAGTIRIGISGWRYKRWRKNFYPENLAQHRELEYASRALPTIEINGSFYSLQTPASYLQWRNATPQGFVFSVKGSRYITHMLRLREFHKPLANFLASGLFNLRGKLGPIVWQFPPNFRFKPEVLEPFLQALPHDTQHALEIARRHDHRMEGRALLRIDEQRPMRHAMGVRHESFVDPDFISLLRKYRVSFVVADTAKRWPEYHDVTADFVYVRLHGGTRLYHSGYGTKSLDRWTARLLAWSRGSQPADARLLHDKAPRKRSARAEKARPATALCRPQSTLTANGIMVHRIAVP